MIDRLVRHIRYASRLLARSPLFTLTAVASLAIGIGANVAIFSVANALLLAPTYGVRDPGRVVDIGRTMEGQGFDTVSFQTYADLRDRNTVFDGVFGTRLEPQALSLGADDGALRVYGELVSASYFDVLGIRPAAGTFFHTAEEHVGVPLRKVVLSHAFWRRQFNAAPDVVGRELRLNGDAFTVVGVAAEGYTGTTIITSDLWIPMTSHARAMMTPEMLRSRRSSFLVMGARLKPGVSVAAAQQYLDGFMRDLKRDHPEPYEHMGLKAAVTSRIPFFGGEVVLPFFGVLIGIVGLVLLVACTNLAGLLLSRATDRSREIAVRLALGAPRSSIVGQLLGETLFIFALGAVAGGVVAALMTRSVSTLIGVLPMPIGVTIGADWRVFLFALALTVTTGVLTGLVPALQSLRSDVSSDLRRDAQTTPRRQRVRRAFIAAQLAFCLVLVVVAGLFLRALDAATRTNPGFEVDAIEIASLDLALGGYPDDQSPRVADELRGRFAALPGVEAVGIGAMIPLEGGGLGLGALRRAGSTGPESFIDTDWNVISPEYLPALRTPIVRGRNFTAADRAGAPRVAIVNEHLANTVWPGRDPIGQVLENGDFRSGRESTIERITVVGVARDAKYRWLGEAPAPFIYVPLAQNPMRSVHYFLRRAGGPSPTDLQASVRHALKAFDPDLPLVRYAPFRSSADVGLVPQRVAASLAGSLGVVALLLAAIGVYGVTAFAVASRTREIGVRMALGADAGRVVRELVGQGARLAGIGAGLGLLGALGVTRLLAGLLFGVSPFDVLTFGVTTGVLGAIALTATYLPARRAGRIDPLIALRSE